MARDELCAHDCPLIALIELIFNTDRLEYTLTSHRLHFLQFSLPFNSVCCSIKFTMKSLALVALAAACIQPALGHYRFYKYIDAAGAVNGECVYIRPNTNINSPVSLFDSLLF